jgi:serine/threonine protein kinase
LGSCARSQCGTNGQPIERSFNASASNLYDISWSNRATVVDVEAINPSISPSGKGQEDGDAVAVPCYLPLSTVPTYFGGDAALMQATWQSSTSSKGPGGPSSLAVQPKINIEIPKDCTATGDSSGPASWTVGLQQSTLVQTISLYSGAELKGVTITVGDSTNPTDNATCWAVDILNTGEGVIVPCSNGSGLQGKYVSIITANSRLSLCKVQVWPLAANAALGKYAEGSASEGAPAGLAVDGITNTCTQLPATGGDDLLESWMSIDLGYTANVDTIVIKKGSTSQPPIEGANGVVIRLGASPLGSEEDSCNVGVSILQDYQPVQLTCKQPGRYLTIYRKTTVPSTLSICEVFVYLKEGPDGFASLPPRSPPPPPVPSLSPGIPPPPSSSDSQSAVTLQLNGADVVPWTLQLQSQLMTSLNQVWAGQRGILGVTFATFATNNTTNTRRRHLLQNSTGGESVLAEVIVNIKDGFTTEAENYITKTVGDGIINAALESNGAAGITATLKSIVDYTQGRPIDTESSNGDTDTSAIIGGVIGGIALVVGVGVGGAWYARKQKRKTAAMHGGSNGTLPVLKKIRTNGYYALSVPPGEETKGPSQDVMSFLQEDAVITSIAAVGGASTTGAGTNTTATTPVAIIGDGELAPSPSATGLLLRSSRSSNGSSSNANNNFVRTASGVSELWLVDYKELAIQKQIGEGSFGKVYLAIWRETTVAVKVLGGMTSASSLDEEFPDSNNNNNNSGGGGIGDRGPSSPSSFSSLTAPKGKTHPLLEALQREAGMMASLRHPSIVMYLGVCLEPPAVITEYCGRGSMNDVLRKAKANNSLAMQLDWPRRLNMALDAAKGMLYLHSCSPPIIHRDLKSPNLLVDKHWRVKVCDFNLSRVMESSAVLSSVAATNPRWLAPEILSGKGYTFASDVFAFGVILWELLTWTVPWPDHGPWQVVAMITEGRQRPETPTSMDQLKGGGFPGINLYTDLMQDCWHQDAEARPSFAVIISRLRAMLANEAQRLSKNPESPMASRVRGQSSLAYLSTSGDNTRLSEEFANE